MSPDCAGTRPDWERAVGIEGWLLRRPRPVLCCLPQLTKGWGAKVPAAPPNTLVLLFLTRSPAGLIRQREVAF